MKEKIESYLHRLDKPLWGLSFYFILVGLVLWNQCGTSFVDDSLEWIVSFQKQGWRGYWHSYDMTSVYWFHDFFSNCMHLLFGKNNFGWYFVILSFHSSSSYFLYKFLVCILGDAKRVYNVRVIAFIASLTFLFGGYNTENLFWIATYHYAITMLYLFIGLFQIAKSKGYFKWTAHGWLILVFPLMLTMHEISFFFPFAFLATIVYYRYPSLSSRVFIYELIKLGLPFAFFSILILICTKIIKGSFIPHYGISHVQDHSLYGFFYTLINYVVKHLFFIHNFSFQIRERCYDVDAKTMSILFLFLVLVLSFALFKIRKHWIEYRDYILLSFLFVLFYLPVSNMYFFWHFPIQNDRLFYFPSAFLYSLLGLILIENFKKIGILIASLFLIANMVVLRMNISKLESAIFFAEKIAIPSYKPYIHAKPVILNMPYNYQGFYAFRKIFRFKSSMYWAYEKDIDFTYTTSMPFFNSTDSIVIDKWQDSAYKITLHAPGSWLMKESLGGSDYENEEVKVDYSDDNQSAVIHLKKYNNDQPILYCTGNRGFVRLN